MIETVLDGHSGNTFLNQPRPVYTLASFSGTTFDDYRREAQNFVKAYAKERIVIVHIPQEHFSLNLFSLALFVESCRIDNDIDAAVFKVADEAKALAEYKPFVALTIAVKYVMRLCKEDTARIYHEFTELGYLGLDITQDYFKDETALRLKGSEDLVRLTPKSTQEAVANVGMLKALSLLKNEANIELLIKNNPKDTALDEDAAIAQILKDITPWVKIG